MRRNYERLAWTVLLLAFAICVATAVFVPWATLRYLRYSYTGELVTLVAQEGNLLLVCPDSAISVNIKERQENPCEGREGAQVSAGPNDKGLLSFHPRSTITATLATVQLYLGTRITVKEARAPRFSFSPEPYRVVMHMENGRIRVVIPPQRSRGILLQVTTPQALVQLGEGNISVEATNQESQVIVHDGQAAVVSRANNSGAAPSKEQRVVVSTGAGVTELMPAPRNFIVDSDFQQPLDSAWKPYTGDPQYPDESRGEAKKIMTVEGRQAVELARVGAGHAETGIVQDINRDISDYGSLQLRVVLRVLQQDVPVCGTLGTECPVMVRIDYVDEGGGARSWQKGFYYLPDLNVPSNPDFCVSCIPRTAHTRVPQEEPYPYESPNLIADLAQIGPPPVTLKSVSIYASGHTYQAQVIEIELVGQE